VDPALPRKRFRVILADPPWKFKTWSKRGLGRSPDRHYRTMTLKQLKALPIGKVAKKNCVLFLWVPWPHLLQGLEVISAWGFSYRTVAFVWVKCTGGSRLAWGCGYWSRANTEVCLLATRGKPRRINADVHQVIIAPRREHSRKPAAVHERIERLVRGPYLELFARERWRGWTSWGNELGKFDDPVGDIPAGARNLRMDKALVPLGQRDHQTKVRRQTA
jgi:N6-adenosine-specific RNA methylase IME4